MPEQVVLRVNGEEYSTSAEPLETLADVLRHRLGLTGTKKGCGEGSCGACTVLLDGEAVNSCLVPAVQAQGHNVVTIEGLARGEELHPIQKAFVEAGAIQCGYCTPGMVLSAKALLDRNPHPTEQDIKVALSGNLCRCTGYQKILAAVKLAQERIRRAGD